MAQLKQVTVGIVGAGIGGLTLAKMLELLGISYVLWEARSGIDEAAGAGLGLMPNGLRILDQLGLFEEIHKHNSPHHSWEYRDADGTVYQTLTAMKALKTDGFEGKLVWFLFIDLEDPIPLGQGKRYATKDIEAIYEQILDVAITPGVKFADIYNNRKAAVMAALEEGITDIWYAGRMFLLGDAAHKMLPHNAMGAGQAMESAACFVNQLMEFRNKLEPTAHSKPGISLADVQQCLEAYAQKRKIRTMPLLNSANMACQCLLKIGQTSKAHLEILVKTTNEDLIAPKLLEFSLAEKLEN